MKKKNIVIISTALFALTIAAAVPYYYASAASRSQKNFTAAGQFKRGGKNLSAEDQAAMKEKMDAMRAQQEAKKQAVEKALEANDYNAWLAAVGKDCPMAQKITQDNFSKLVEIYNLKKQIQTKEKELGIANETFGMYGFGRHGAK